MTETEIGENYSCSWSKNGELYTIVVDNYPNIIATSKNFFECEDSVYTTLHLELGDFEASLFYPQGLPDDEFASKYSHPEYYLIVSDYGCNIYHDIEKYYLHGVCDVCTFAFCKERNNKAFELSCEAQRTDSIQLERTNAIVFSEKIFNVLESYNTNLYSLRKVVFNTEKKVDFYELIPSDKMLSIDTVAVDDDSFGRFLGWMCKSCGAGDISYLNESGSGRYIARHLVTKTNVEMFMVRNRHLVVSRRVLDEIRKSNPKKVRFKTLGIVGKNSILKNPKISIKEPSRKSRPRLP